MGTGLQLFVNAIKAALSDEALRNAAAFADIVRRMPEWQAGVCSLQARIPFTCREHCELICELAMVKMQDMKFHSSTIQNFECIFGELTSNVFDHGFGNSKRGRATFAVEISQNYASITVENPWGNKFNADDLIIRGRSQLKETPEQERGRGLVICAELSDTFQATQSRRGLKAVFYSPAVEMRTSRISQLGSRRELVILHILTGHANPSLSRRLENAIQESKGRFLMVDFSNHWLKIAKARRIPRQVWIERTGTSTQTFTTAIRVSEKLRKLEPTLPRSFVVLSDDAKLINYLSDLNFVPKDVFFTDIRKALEVMEFAHAFESVESALLGVHFQFAAEKLEESRIHN